MDNWLVFLLVNVILVVVLGVITNLITPSIQSAYDKSIFSSRQKRIARLISDYRTIKSYKEDKVLLLVISLRFVVYGLMIMLLSITGLIVSATGGRENHIFLRISSVVFICGVLVALLVFYITVIIPNANATSFRKYREETIQKLIKLGGNPEDLDKEETVVPAEPERYYGGG